MAPIPRERNGALSECKQECAQNFLTGPTLSERRCCTGGIAKCGEHAANVVTIVRRFSVRRHERQVVHSQVVRIEVVSLRVSGLLLALM